jgi:hypothetical protein
VSLEELCADWLEAKTREQKANADRVAVEQKIEALTGKKDEGSQTHEAGTFKVTVTGKVTRKMDWDKWATVRDSIPAELHPVKMKPELDERGVKWLRDNRPDLYERLPIEVKTAKTAVEVKTV